MAGNATRVILVLGERAPAPGHEQMTTTLRTTTTSTATLTVLEPGLIEQRYHVGAQFSREGLEENRLAVTAICEQHGPCVILGIFPAGMQVQPELMNNDVYRDQRNKGHMWALAVVVDSPEMYTASKLYFLYHQQPFETRVFEEEHDARRWLRDQLAAKE
jgi:hypothetical protein